MTDPTVFGRDVRDGMPFLQVKYNPHEFWKETLDNKEKALARRHIHGVKRWSENTKPWPKSSLGDDVYIQNLVGNHPRRWERTGKIVECKDFDQYNVKIDGTGRCTLRNRKHIRKFTPVSLSENPSPVIPSQIRMSPYVEPPVPVDFKKGKGSTPVANEIDGREENIGQDSVTDEMIDEPPPPPVLVHDPQVIQDKPPTPPPNVQDISPRRSQRVRQPNRASDPAVWDLGSASMETLPLMTMLVGVKKLMENLETQMKIHLSSGGR